MLGIGYNGDGSVLTILQLWSSLNLHVVLMNAERRHTHTISLSLSFDPLTILL
jgi:hypothetical protein